MTKPRLIGLYSSTPGQGKSTVASILVDCYGFDIHPFAGPLKRLTVEFIMQFGYSRGDARKFVNEDKEAPLLLIPGQPTTRHLMQTLGTEWGRDLVHRDVWVDMWCSQCPSTPVVSDDMRFTSEASVIKEWCGEWWMVVRPKPEKPWWRRLLTWRPWKVGHSSEGALDHLQFDRVIINDGTELDLVDKVAEALGRPA